MSYVAQKAFTVVELLATSVIATLLLGALLAMLGVLARDRQRVAASHTRAEGLQRVCAVLRRDLSNSEFLSVTDGGPVLSLRGYAAVDRVSGRPSGRAALIEYATQRVDQRSVLVRRQRPLDDPNSESVRSELLADDIIALDVEPMLSRPSSPPTSHPTGDIAMPRAVHVRMIGIQGTVQLDEVWAIQ